MSMTKGLFVFLSTYMPAVGWCNVTIAKKPTLFLLIWSAESQVDAQESLNLEFQLISCYQLNIYQLCAPIARPSLMIFSGRTFPSNYDI